MWCRYQPKLTETNAKERGGRGHGTSRCVWGDVRPPRTGAGLGWGGREPGAAGATEGWPYPRRGQASSSLALSPPSRLRPPTLTTYPSRPCTAPRRTSPPRAAPHCPASLPPSPALSTAPLPASGPGIAHDAGAGHGRQHPPGGRPAQRPVVCLVHRCGGGEARAGGWAGMGWDGFRAGGSRQGVPGRGFQAGSSRHGAAEER